MQRMAFLDSEGRVNDPKALRKRIFYGGVVHELRKEVCIFMVLMTRFLLYIYIDFEALNFDHRYGLSCWDAMITVRHMLNANIYDQ